jgi:hypothetical protein
MFGPIFVKKKECFIILDILHCFIQKDYSIAKVTEIVDYLRNKSWKPEARDKIY